MLSMKLSCRTEMSIHSKPSCAVSKSAAARDARGYEVNVGGTGNPGGVEAREHESLV